ncbi:MAG: hypothetical protein CL608_00930 [Anaerolineaceae bacterium]|nr:hypothetical protein [Anaerolineaceae bacterium]
MSDAYYTYRIHIANRDRVQVNKLNPLKGSLGQPSGAFGYKDALKDQIDALVQKANEKEWNSDDQVKVLGEALFNALFEPTLRQDFVGLYNQVVHTEGKLLRIELDIDEKALPDVAALPWEFMRLPAAANLGTLWIGSAPDLIFSRRRSQWFVPNPIQLNAGEKLRIAIAVSAPADLGAVEYENVIQGLEKLQEKQPDKFELLPVLTDTNAEKLDGLLAQDPHILHFIGHGKLVEANGKVEGQIAFVDDMLGDAMWVDADFFADLLNTHRPGIVLLQACEGAQTSSSEAFVGVASRVVQQNIPVVVAMQYEVSNMTAVRFSLKFYQEVAAGSPVDRAAQNGRRAIGLATQYKRRDFATPVLFMRVEDGHLFEREGEPANENGNQPNAPAAAGDDKPVPAAPATLTLQQVAALGRLISDNFTPEELRDFTLALGLDYDDLRGSNKSGKSRELADHARRHGAVAALWQQLYEARGHIDWSQALN